MQIFAKLKPADVAFNWTLSLMDNSLNETCKDGLKFQYYEDSATHSIMRENYQQCLYTIRLRSRRNIHR